MAEKYWEMANLVTGFAAAQMIVTVLALGSQPSFALSVIEFKGIPTIILMVFFGFLYAWAVCQCYGLEVRIRGAISVETINDSNKRCSIETDGKYQQEILETSRLAMNGRLISIAIFTLLGVLTMIATILAPPTCCNCQLG